jgi:N-acetylglucosaminyldiphosphoundecaprenol N-acetyl-beta-D-mannosaminyltransferase
MQINLPKKQSILGISISQTSYEEVVALCSQWAVQRKSSHRTTARYICVTSVHGIVMAQDDAEVREILNEADIATPDGMPVVWALRSFGSSGQQRVYGPTLMLEICRKAATEGHRVFLYGGREKTLPELKENLLRLFPGLIISGSYSPPFRALTESEEQNVHAMIQQSEADIVFVGISSPRQEKWM